LGKGGKGGGEGQKFVFEGPKPDVKKVWKLGPCVEHGVQGGGGGGEGENPEFWEETLREKEEQTYTEQQATELRIKAPTDRREVKGGKELGGNVPKKLPSSRGTIVTTNKPAGPKRSSYDAWVERNWKS